MVSAVLFVVSIILLLVGLSPAAFNLYDEGITLYGADRILSGEVQYRDFWALYGPAQFSVLAGLFKVFGPSILVGRLWDVFIKACFAVIAFKVVDRMASRWLALASWFLSLAWLWSIAQPFGYPLVPAGLFVLLAAHALMIELEEPGKPRRMILVGVLLGIAALFRHDVGFYGFIASVIAMMVVYFRERGLPRSDDALPSFGVSFLRLCAGCTLIGGPVAVYLLAVVPFDDLWRQFVDYPFNHYAANRALPYPSLVEYLSLATASFGERWYSRGLDSLSLAVVYYLHFVLLFLSVVVLARVWRRDWLSEDESRTWHGILVLAFLVSAMLLKLIVRPHIAHMIQVLVPGIVLAAVLLQVPDVRFRAIVSPFLGLALLGLCIHPLARLVVSLEHPQLNNQITWEAQDAADGIPRSFFESLSDPPPGPPRARYFAIDEDQAAAIDYVRAHSEESERIYVGLHRHDRIWINDILFYFLAERGSATRYHELDPGLANTALIQEEIIFELAQDQTRLVVLLTIDDRAFTEPNDSSISTGITLLDEYIRENYTPVFEAGRYQVLRRR